MLSICSSHKGCRECKKAKTKLVAVVEAVVEMAVVVDIRSRTSASPHRPFSLSTNRRKSISTSRTQICSAFRFCSHHTPNDPSRQLTPQSSSSPCPTSKPRSPRPAAAPSPTLSPASTPSTSTSVYVVQFDEVQSMVGLSFCNEAAGIGRKTDENVIIKVHGVSFKKRAPRAIKEIKDFAEKAMVCC